MADCMEKDWSFTGSDGVHTLYATIWEPSEGEPRAVIQICHGMMEHIRRYDRFARALCELEEKGGIPARAMHRN